MIPVFPVRAEPSMSRDIKFKEAIQAFVMHTDSRKIKSFGKLPFLVLAR